MAKVYEPSSREIYGPLKGIVDFYYHKGQLCARSYPERCRQPGTPEQVQCWQAQRNKWTASRLLSENDKRGYSNVSGGSQLTWIDLFSKTYIKGWHMRKRVPPMVYGVTVGYVFGFLRLCYTATEDCVGEVYYENDYSGKKVKPWKWMLVMPSPPPPNCSIKRKIGYTFKHKIDVALSATGERECLNILTERFGYGKWVMVAIKGGTGENAIFRTGAWYVAN